MGEPGVQPARRWKGGGSLDVERKEGPMSVIEFSSGLSESQYKALKALIEKESKQIMATIEEVKAAVTSAVAAVKTDLATAISKEKTEISAQIQALKDQIAAGATISPADLDSILASVNSIGTVGVAGVDSISTEDGAV